jgi:RNA polymerase-binding transcription factor DksA
MDTTHYKSKLEEEKKLLEEELGRLGIKDPATGDWGAILEEQDESDQSDMNDRGDRDEDFTVRANTLGELEIRYNKILKALEKIENGTYGVCEISGKPIEEDRLEANPAARTCKADMDKEDTLDQ